MAASGASLWPLLAVLASGADGDARAELEDAVGLRASEAMLGATALLARLSDARGLASAIAVWIRDEIPIESTWKEALPPAAVLGRLTGRVDVDSARIRDWIVERTEGLIAAPDIAVAPDDFLFLASTIVIRTSWSQPFDERIVRPSAGPWKGQELSGLTARFHDLGRLRVVQTESGRLTVFSSGGKDDVDVYLVRGEDESPAWVLGEGIRAIAGQHPFVELESLQEGQSAPGVFVHEVVAPTPRPYVNLTTVAFDGSQSHDVRGRSIFGLGAASRPGRMHFPGISPALENVDQARQSARVRFTASGFEAAAATLMAARGLSAPAPGPMAREYAVSFDRPFAYFAVDRPTGLVLMFGWVADAERFDRGQFRSDLSIMQGR